jgi:hypothetical protein
MSHDDDRLKELEQDDERTSRIIGYAKAAVLIGAIFLIYSFYQPRSEAADIIGAVALIALIGGGLNWFDYGKRSAANFRQRREIEARRTRPSSGPI